jgi:hypothetical protein
VVESVFVEVISLGLLLILAHFLFFWMLPPKHLFDFMLKNKWKQENLFIQSQKGAKGESWVR